MDFSVTSAKPLESLPALDDVAVDAGDAPADDGAPPAGGDTRAAVRSDTATTLVRGGFVERVLGEAHTTTAAVPAPLPGERVDKGMETANMQTFARPHAPVTEPLKPAVNALPTHQHANSEFAVPAAQLTTATLIGLQVEHTTQFPLSPRGFDPDPRPLFEARIEARHHHTPHDDEFAEEPEDEVPEPTITEETEAPPPAPVLEDEDEGAWCEALTRALRVALGAKVPPQALQVAAEQWQRGRCVVLACPQGIDPAGAAWAFVLWPRRNPARTESTPATLDLYGLRVDARLQWSTPPARATWHHVRVVKTHHPRTGRQLVPATAEPSGRVACEVQLGPVIARVLRPCDVCVRIGAARRFWTALSTQWSMHVVVATFPLVDDGHGIEEVSR